MLVQLLIGAAAVGAAWLLVEYFRRSGYQPHWWGWLLTIVGLLYSIFVLEVIVGFLGEGEPQAALVMGMLTGIAAVIYWVVMKRFVFIPAETEGSPAEINGRVENEQ